MVCAFAPSFRTRQRSVADMVIGSRLLEGPASWLQL